MSQQSKSLSRKSPQSVVEVGVDSYSRGLVSYLDFLGLPSQGVLVEPEERLVVISNLPAIVTKLTPECKYESMYISKFIAACGAGLFDAAINFLWNETVVNLRQKVINFDMAYFLDSVITDSKKRELFRNEEDFVKLEDWELIKGCKDTGIITDIGYKHLDYIRDMRNYASAAHPNHNNLDGLQLSSWLQTCIKEVLAKQPEGPVIEVKRLLHNLRTNTLEVTDVAPITAQIQLLPIGLVDSTIRAVFGMFTDPGLAANIKNNLRLVASAFWGSCSKQAKYDMGLKYAVFSANADLDRKKFAHEFLSFVDGLAYLSTDQKALDMDQLLDSLESAHFGYNNFHNEPPYAKLLGKYVPETGEIPESVEVKYVRTIVGCRIGNQWGISIAAKPVYDKLITGFTDKQFLEFVYLLWDDDIRNKFIYGSCSQRYKDMAENFIAKTANVHLKDVLRTITTASKELLYNLSKDYRFGDTVRSIVIRG